MADSVYSRTILEKYRVPFIYDVARYLETLDRIEGMRARMFVPAHAGVTEDIRSLVRFNRAKIYAIEEKLLSVCRDSLCTDEIIRRIFMEYGLTMGIEQYVLVGSTLRSFLS